MDGGPVNSAVHPIKYTATSRQHQGPNGARPGDQTPLSSKVAASPDEMEKAEKLQNSASTSSMDKFMELALKQAKLALDNLEVPVGCVIVEDGKVIACGSNRTNETRNATRHAEMEAIDILLNQWQEAGLAQSDVAEKFSKCVLYVTCEPCIMCATALSIVGMGEVFYGCSNDKFGGCGSVLSLHENSSLKGVPMGKGFKCSGGFKSFEAVTLLRTFYEQGNPNGPSKEGVANNFPVYQCVLSTVIIC